MVRLDDTIVAIATAPGAAGLAVVRVSGGAALATADRVFRGAAPLAGATSHTLHHGWVLDPSGTAARIDEVVAAVFRAPRSYTREDVVELSCHGGEHSARRVRDALTAAGGRPARAGEFTLRAFLNGRIDLTQAEAVADVIHASTERAHALAVSQLAGRLSATLRGMIDRLTDLVAEVEARVDFAEDVGGIEVPAHVRAAIARAVAELGALLDGAAYGRAVREGARVPIVGRPNVGKSSLFNALIEEQRVIVTPVPGTTRDRVSEPIEVAGVRVTLSDTAGLRDTLDPVEAIGVSLTEEAIEGGALLIWVVDASQPLSPEDAELGSRLASRRVLAVLNKIDRGRRVEAEAITELLGSGCSGTAEVSALRGDGIEELRLRLADLLGAGGSDVDLDGRVTNARHAEGLERARAALIRARAVAEEGAPGEIVALELHEALMALGEVTGIGVGEDVLERIFSRFCIGK